MCTPHYKLTSLLLVIILLIMIDVLFIIITTETRRSFQNVPYIAHLCYIFLFLNVFRVLKVIFLYNEIFFVPNLRNGQRRRRRVSQRSHKSLRVATSSLRYYGVYYCSTVLVHVT